MEYWLNAMGRHSLQSPFIYDLYTQVINPKISNPRIAWIEKLREKLKADNELIPITDYGAGSKVDNSHQRKISDIAIKGISQRKYSEILHRLVTYTGSKNIIELGTSLGINTLYLSENKDSHVTTFEGASSLCQLANNMFRKNMRRNIDVIEGNIDKTLPEFISECTTIDMVYFDANHQYQPTIDYFNLCRQRIHEKSCFIFDDIHLSKEMDKAWQEIHQHYEVSLSVDLFQVGIIFFTPELSKQHYVLEC